MAKHDGCRPEDLFCVLDRLAGQRSLLVNPRHTQDQRHLIEPPLRNWAWAPACGVREYQQVARKEPVPATVVAFRGQTSSEQPHGWATRLSRTTFPGLKTTGECECLV